MVAQAFEIRGYLLSLYTSFSESLQFSFMRVVSDPKAGIQFPIHSRFSQLAREQQGRFIALVDAQLHAMHESRADVKLERFAATIKVAMSDDIDTMTNNIKRFAINVSHHQSTGLSLQNAFTKERERMFANESLYRLSSLGKLTQRLL